MPSFEQRQKTHILKQSISKRKVDLLKNGDGSVSLFRLKLEEAQKYLDELNKQAELDNKKIVKQEDIILNLKQSIARNS